MATSYDIYYNLIYNILYASLLHARYTDPVYIAVLRFSEIKTL